MAPFIYAVSSIHILLIIFSNCSLPLEIWLEFAAGFKVNIQETDNLKIWVHGFLLIGVLRHQNWFWKYALPAFMWAMWRDRNGRLFHDRLRGCKEVFQHGLFFIWFWGVGSGHVTKSLGVSDIMKDWTCCIGQ